VGGGVKRLFNIHTDSGRTFVKKSKPRAVVEKPCHCQPLLLTETEYVGPVFGSIPPAVTFD
jgi:hypothetical protein